MPNVDRKDFVSRLQSLEPALAKREILEQSTCVVFDNGWMAGFNEECSVKTPSGLPNDFRGAIKAKPLIDLLSKLKAEQVQLVQVPPELRIIGDGFESGIVMQADIRLPINMVEVPTEWRALPPDFLEAMDMAVECASQDDSAKFVVRCVHVNPNWIEATDNIRLTRYYLKTGFAQPCLIRRSSVQSLSKYPMIECSETRLWVHFRTEGGLVYSCKRYLDEFPDMGAILQVDSSTPAELPKEIVESAKLATIFAAEASSGKCRVLVSLGDGKVFIRGQSVVGWYEEEIGVNYDGRPIRFSMSPKLLTTIVKKFSSVGISEKKLKVCGPDNVWECVVYLAPVLPSQFQKPSLGIPSEEVVPY